MSIAPTRVNAARRAITPLAIALAAATACATTVALAASTTEFARTVPADPRGQVAIGNFAGSLTITGWDRSEVDVKGQLGPGVERVDVQRDG